VAALRGALVLRAARREAAGAGEVRHLLELALPAAATQLSMMLMGVVDTAMVGRVGVDATASLVLSNVWIFGVLMLANGVLFGLDPIISQAHGAGDGPACARALQRGCVWALLLSAPAAGLLALTEQGLLFFGQEPALARAAGSYAVVQIPSVPFFLLYAALRQYLQGRGIVHPALWVIVAANLVNVAGNWMLIFGKLGAPALGLVGAGISTAITRALCFLGLLLWVWGFGLQRGAWLPWSLRAALDVRGLRQIFSYGWPVALQISLEMWAFSAAALIAGGFGATAVAAHTAALQLASLAFMLPLGIAQAASTRVGNLIGARRYAAAQSAAGLALGLGAGVMCCSALAFWLLRGQLPRLFSEDLAVIQLASSVLPIAAAFQIFDGTQVVGCGVLRGMGRPRPVLAVNLVSYWVLGIPLGAWLALHWGWQLHGLWWGLCAGLAAAASLLVVWIQHNGPASLERSARAARPEPLGRAGAPSALEPPAALVAGGRALGEE
jgi:MATE family multidrug resistance protein